MDLWFACDIGVYIYHDKLGISSMNWMPHQARLQVWRLYIVGTAHISAQSAADVEENRNGPGICENSEITTHV